MPTATSAHLPQAWYSAGELTTSSSFQVQQGAPACSKQQLEETLVP